MVVPTRRFREFTPLRLKKENVENTQGSNLEHTGTNKDWYTYTSMLIHFHVPIYSIE